MKKQILLLAFACASSLHAAETTPAAQQFDQLNTTAEQEPFFARNISVFKKIDNTSFFALVLSTIALYKSINTNNKDDVMLYMGLTAFCAAIKILITSPLEKISLHSKIAYQKRLLAAQ